MKIRIAPVFALVLAAGCSSKSVSYGAPTQPSGSQMQAVTSLTSVGETVTLGVKGMATADQMFDVHGLMAGLQGTAINSSGSAQALSLSPESLDPSCVTGSSSTGFTYNHCATGDGGTIDGSVKITPTSVTYDNLKITSGSTELVLDGSVTDSAGSITGDLQYKIHTDLGAAGKFGGVANADITTDVNFAMTYTDSPSCITGGTIEVKVDYAGKLHGAKFLFSGCSMLTVQNG